MSNKQANRQYQNRTDGQDVAMIDAPPASSNAVGPRKLELRQPGVTSPGGSGPGKEVSQDASMFKEQHIEVGLGSTRISVATYGPAYGIADEQSNPSSREHGSQRPPTSTRGAINHEPEAGPNPGAPSYADYEHLKKSLGNEQQLRQTADAESAQLRADVAQLQQQLDTDHALRGKVESELRQREAELEENGKQWEVQMKEMKEMKSRWKQIARELNGLRAQGQRFYQVTDTYLVGLITPLRYSIRNFSIQYFSGKLSQQLGSKLPKYTGDFWEYYVKATTPRSKAYLDYLDCPTRRPSVIQAILWRFISTELFGNFRWVGAASNLMWDLSRTLNPHPSLTSSPTPEAIRKFHIWTAGTVGLLLDSMDTSTGSETDGIFQEWKHRIFEDVNAAIQAFQVVHNEGYRQDFLSIIDQAIELDIEISKQVSCVEWISQLEDEKATFDASNMELEKGERASKNKQKVILVTSPGVRKRGKSTGDDFDSEMLLLKMEVSCDAPQVQR